MFKEAYEKGDHECAIMNVSNIREFPMALQTSSDMLWDMEDFQPEEALKNWCAKRYPTASAQTYAAYQRFFDSYQLVGDKQIPGFLDGQQRGRALRILRELKRQIENPRAYAVQQEKARKRKPDAFGISLSDTNPAGGWSLEKLLPKVRQQLAELAITDSLAQVALTDLNGDAKTLFETNLIAQVQILKGIGYWFENCILAKQSMDDGNKNESEDYLTKAVAAFEQIKKGKALASYGKWQYWYRGDVKMNLEGAEVFTKEILELLKQNKN